MSHLSLNILVRRDANETKEELFERIVSTAEEYFETVKVPGTFMKQENYP
ncbi:MAG: hypothetical protein J6K26_02255 [Lachnospiraceae bacterium]|nr:hypothetical protein [Lachnospiraceae bacterium]